MTWNLESRLVQALCSRRPPPYSCSLQRWVSRRAYKLEPSPRPDPPSTLSPRPRLLARARRQPQRQRPLLLPLSSRIPPFHLRLRSLSPLGRRQERGHPSPSSGRSLSLPYRLRQRQRTRPLPRLLPRPLLPLTPSATTLRSCGKNAKKSSVARPLPPPPPQPPSFWPNPNARRASQLVRRLSSPLQLKLANSSLLGSSPPLPFTGALINSSLPLVNILSPPTLPRTLLVRTRFEVFTNASPVLSLPSSLPRHGLTSSSPWSFPHSPPPTSTVPPPST
jgi:hypothetical protein